MRFTTNLHNQQYFKGLVPLKCTCISLAWQTFFELLSCTLDIWDHNGDVPVVVGWWLVGSIVDGATVVACLGGVVGVIGILVEVVVSFKLVLELV